MCWFQILTIDQKLLANWARHSVANEIVQVCWSKSVETMACIRQMKMAFEQNSTVLCRQFFFVKSANIDALVWQLVFRLSCSTFESRRTKWTHKKVSVIFSRSRPRNRSLELLILLPFLFILNFSFAERKTEPVLVRGEVFRRRNFTDCPSACKRSE